MSPDVHVYDDRGEPADSERFEAIEATLKQIVGMLSAQGVRFDNIEHECKAMSQRLAVGDTYFFRLFDVLNKLVSMQTAFACDARSGPGRSRVGSLAGISVLLVEDSDHCREAVERRLDEQGASVIAVASPEEAIRVVTEELMPDVAIVDQRLRGAAGGDTVLRVIADASPFCGLVLTSGLPLDDTTRLVSSFGGRVRLLQKPHGVNELLTTVKTAYNDARGRRDTDPPDTEPAP
jgi:CheY-like chemotaxis protein